VAFIVFSGLPASGKSTLAREGLRLLGLPLLDKDEGFEVCCRCPAELPEARTANG